MDDVVPMQVVDCFEHLLDGLRRVLLGKPSLVANPIEQLSACGQLCDDVVLVLAES